MSRNPRCLRLHPVIVGIFVLAWLISYVVYRINGYDEIEASAG
jgi:high-affinity nickel permease